MKALSLAERARRVIDECRRIATMTEEPGLTTRRFLTAPVREVHALLRQRMEALDMTVALDAAGNLRGKLQPQDTHGRRLILGSHIDTVPDAGPFDGVLGVVLALEWAEFVHDLHLPLPIEVIAFSEEEGVRFGVPFIGSRAVAGRFDPSLLLVRDDDGVMLDEAIRAFGLDSDKISDASLDENVLGFVEVHIEQGPVLESEGIGLAAVTSIVGQSRHVLTFIGHANHAGTTPMRLRRDALAGAAEWIAAVEARALQTDELVATVGKLDLAPNAGNVIPGKVRVSFEVRHAADSIRTDATLELLKRAEAITERRNLELQCIRQMDQPSVPMDERLTAYLAEAMEAEGMPVRRMPSGAGHDAMVMAARVPTAMLFLRSPGGISHHPDETVLEEDVDAALRVGRKFLERLAAEVR